MPHAQAGLDFEAWSRQKAQERQRRRQMVNSATDVMHDRCELLHETRLNNVLQSQVRVAVRAANREGRPANPQIGRHAHEVPPLGL